MTPGAAPRKGFSADAFRRLSTKLAVMPEVAPSPAPETKPAPAPAPPFVAPSSPQAPPFVAPEAPPPVHIPVAQIEDFPAPELLPEPAPVRVLRREIQLTDDQMRKADLARTLIDMMAASGGTGQPQERALAADTLLELQPDLRGPVLVTLAERVAMMEAPPPALVTRLALNEDLNVSGPLLEEGQQVTDQDLLSVIARGAADKLRLIARRRRITRAVSEAIASSGDPSAMLTLIRNQGAEISGAGFETLMQAAKSDADLLAPLCTRQDLPAYLALELFWMAPTQLRRYLMSRFLVDSEALTAILKIRMESGVNSSALFHTPDKESVIACLGALIGDNPAAGFEMVAQCARISPATVARIAGDTQGEALVALFKVMGIPRSEVTALLQEFAAGDYPMLNPERDLEELQAIFDQLSFSKARFLMTYWDWSSGAIGPYAKKP